MGGPYPIIAKRPYFLTVPTETWHITSDVVHRYSCPTADNYHNEKHGRKICGLSNSTEQVTRKHHIYPGGSRKNATADPRLVTRAMEETPGVLVEGIASELHRRKFSSSVKVWFTRRREILVVLARPNACCNVYHLLNLLSRASNERSPGRSSHLKNKVLFRRSLEHQRNHTPRTGFWK